MTDSALAEQLARHKTLGAAPREELAWLATHGTLRHLAAGDVLTAKGAQVQGMSILLTGHVAIGLFAWRQTVLSSLAVQR